MHRDEMIKIIKPANVSRTAAENKQEIDIGTYLGRTET